MSEGQGSSTRAPYADERHQHILATLRSVGRIEAASLAEELGVTGETVRKDLIHLERSGLLRRVHGGAIPVDQLSYEPAVSARTSFTDEKTRIARAALAHLPRRGSILIDAGSTTSVLAELIPADIELTVYTNTLPIALNLLSRPRLTVYTLGGRLRSTTLAEVDDWAARALDDINVDVAFLGTNGISFERGLTTPDAEEAAIKRRMVSCAQRRVLLADHSKMGYIAAHRHASLDDIDLFITDSGLDKGDLKALSALMTVEQA